MKITRATQNICYPKRLKKLFQTNINLRTYDNFIPHMERAVVGNIPPEIIKLFDKDKGKNILKFQECLSELTKHLRKEYHKAKVDPNFSYFDVNYRPSPMLKKIAVNAQPIFNDMLKELPGNLAGKIEYINHGAYGNVYKIALFDKNNKKIMHDKALKVYHSVKEPVKLQAKIHNTYAESNFWTYLKFWAGHKLDKTQFTKHYISDLHSGYSLTEFIDDKIISTKSSIPFKNMLHIHYKDSYFNPPVMGKIYDIGGFEKNTKFIDDKVVLKYFKKLFHRNPKKDLLPYLTQLQAKVDNKKTPHRKKIQKAIELFKQQFNIT